MGSIRGTNFETDSSADAVEDHELRDSIRPVIDAYDQSVGERDRFLWKWLDLVFPHFTLSTVPSEHETTVRDAKLLASVFVATIDDIAEKRGDRITFEEAIMIPFDHRRADTTRSGVDTDVLTFSIDVWERYESLIRAGPRADEFAEIRRFDLEQVITAIDYSYVANRHPELITERENWRYDSHNMMLFVYADIDLAYSPGFRVDDLASLRRIVAKAQRMARIGNWITTWERELGEGDCSSGVIGNALDRGSISVEDLRSVQEDPSGGNVATIAGAIRAAEIEERFLDRWHEEYAAAEELAPEVASVDVRTYLDGLETVMEYHLASRGKK